MPGTVRLDRFRMGFRPLPGTRSDLSVTDVDNERRQVAIQTRERQCIQRTERRPSEQGPGNDPAVDEG